MKRLFREFRIIPIVLFAVACLLTLKLIGLVHGDGYMLTGGPHLGETLATRIAISRDPRLQEPQVKHRSWAQEMFNYPDITGSVPEAKPAPEKPPAKKPGAD